MSTIDRLPPLDPAAWTEPQRVCAEEIIQGPRRALISPFVPLLRSPELCTHAQRMGEYLRYRSAIGLRLSELAILVTARFWDQQVEWSIHAPIAEREGISPAVVRAIEHQQTPTFEKADEQLVYEVSRQLLYDKRVSDTVWTSAEVQLGAQGIVDLTGIVGYYTMLSLVMNGAQTPPPPDCHRRLPTV
ncbi:MAG: carboxymuconolactone decarboxylase family protein [Acetobacteraceae bacterium]